MNAYSITAALGGRWHGLTGPRAELIAALAFDGDRR